MLVKPVLNLLSNVVKNNVLQNTVRTNFILKRKTPPGLHKRNGNPNGLKGRNYNYELVEYAAHRKQQEINIMLTSSVEGIGEKGDVVSMKPNAAYNKVLLPGLGVYSKTEAKTKDRLVSETFNAKRTASVLSRARLAVVMNKDAPWTLEPWHIRVSLRKMRVYITEDSITMPKETISGPDMSLQNRDFEVQIKVSEQESATVKCRIHHWSTDIKERLPYVFEHWKVETDPIFGGKSTTTETKSV